MARSDAVRPTPILLVEDDPEDVEITRRAFERGRVLNALHVVHDGEEALAFLRRQGPHARAPAPRPGLILLDLNLPRLDGREVLRTLKADAELKRIPVVVLTTSADEADVLGCYELGANTYITKPVQYGKFLEAVVTIGRYWLCVAEIPRNGEGGQR